MLEIKKQELLHKIKILQEDVVAINSAIVVFDHFPKDPISKARTIHDIAIREMVFFAIRQSPDEFTIRDVERIIAVNYKTESVSKKSIASSFWKIANEELKLQVVKEGGAKRPAIYRKPNFSNYTEKWEKIETVDLTSGKTPATN